MTMFLLSTNKNELQQFITKNNCQIVTQTIYKWVKSFD